MFEVYETGLFLKDSYQLHVECYGEPDAKQKELIRRICEWNADPDRFVPDKICGIFQEVSNSGAERKGTFGKKECFRCTGIEARYETGSRIVYRLKGVPEMIAEHISLISGNCACVLLKGKKYYVFIEKEYADAWKTLKPHKILPAGWLLECRNFLHKQAYSRETLAESFMEQKAPVYVIRPGFREAGEVIEPYYFGVALNGAMDNFFLTVEEYMRLYREHYQEDIIIQDGRICMLEFDSNLKYLEKLYRRQSIPNSTRTMEILRTDLKYAIGEKCRWTKNVYWNMDSEDAMAIVWENTERTEAVVIVADKADRGKWQKYFPDAWVCSPQTWEDDLDNTEEKLRDQPVVFVWAANKGFEHKRGWCLLQLLLRFLPVGREFLFLSEKYYSDIKEETDRMESVFYVSGISESFAQEKKRKQLSDFRWVGQTVIRSIEEKEPDKSLRIHLSAYDHIDWLLNHLELYEMPDEWREKCIQTRQSEAAGTLSCEEAQKWYHEFVQQYGNNVFMYINGVNVDGKIHSPVLDAYFLSVGNIAVSLGFLKSVCEDWPVSQRRRIYQWLFAEEEEWNTYLNKNYIEFYAVGGEVERVASDKLRYAQLNDLGALAVNRESRGNLYIEDGIYTKLNDVEDIL